MQWPLLMLKQGALQWVLLQQQQLLQGVVMEGPCPMPEWVGHQLERKRKMMTKKTMKSLKMKRRRILLHH